ncbi:RHS repeat-associated core domain-containing protein [Microbacterium sp. 10M-3C3]|uniref:RHS repeat-associated core domain-containing protein n=1 Tax=Microbacterium sp. 10M-3C3 TaxID=2483401 RepID=UPI000F63BF39|nr:RHS repeat-associated core domain-containing protein [Microbacterium sp. 10M-3C3]
MVLVPGLPRLAGHDGPGEHGEREPCGESVRFCDRGARFGLRQDRYYNGLSTLNGSLGGGWQSNNGANDIGVVAVAGSYVDYFAVNGAKFRFTWNGSAYVGPAGSNLTITRDTASSTARYVVESNKTGEKWKFSTSGWLTSTVDRNGVGETYSYGSGATAGKITSVVAANGRGYTFTYTSGNLTSVTDSAGRAQTYEYDTANRLTEVTTADDKVSTYTYDSTGRLESLTVPSAAAATTTVWFTYDSSHRVTLIEQQPEIETSFAYTSGQTVVTDSNDHPATYTIDSQGRVTAAKDALNRTQSQTWTANSDIATSTDAFATGNITTYTYDGNNNQTGAQLPTGAAASAVYAVGANCSAPNTGTAYQPKCSTDDAGNKKQYQYDPAGNLTKQTDTTTSTAVTEFERTYDNNGTVECGGFAGQVCTTKDGNGNVTSYTYNTAGDLTTVTPPSPLGATTYTYDSLGRVTSVTDGKGDTTSYDYDVRDRIILTTFDNGDTLTSEYYDNGLEHYRTDSAGGQLHFDYDHQGRITAQNGPRSGIDQTFSYDEVGNMLTSSIDSGNGPETTTYTYDAADQLTLLQEQGHTCPAECVAFEYDANGAETKRTLSGGATTVTTRDNSGRPTRITAKDAAAATAVDIGYSYTPTGGTGDRANIQSRTAYKEQGLTAGAVTGYTYDSRNRLTLAQEKAGVTTTASCAYSYDNNGNSTQQVRAGSTGATAGTINYTNNAVNQITIATGQTTTFTYDAAGNQTRNGLTGTTATFGDRGQQTQLGSTSSGYFAAGNTDRLSQGTITFNNGALGLMQRTNGSTTYSFARTPAGQAVGFLSSSSHNHYYYVHDSLGFVVGVFDAAGSYRGGCTYSPYGEARTTGTNSAVTANPLRYIGEHHDGNGIYKLGARYYDTSLGRFTQTDPSGQESHPYGYAGCNPINGKDPSGLISQACADDLASIYGSLISAALSLAALVGYSSTGIGLVLGALYAINFILNTTQAAFALASATRSCA